MPKIRTKTIILCIIFLVGARSYVCFSQSVTKNSAAFKKHTLTNEFLSEGVAVGDVNKDDEGIRNMKNLGENMAWLLKKIKGEITQALFFVSIIEFSFFATTKEKYLLIINILNSIKPS